MTDSFEAYRVGLIMASACTSLDDKEATKLMNQEHPTGISSQWEVSKDEKFSTGQSNPCECPDKSTHRHVLFEC